MILAACDAAGSPARLIQPDAFSRLLTEPGDMAAAVTVIDRLPPTPHSAALAKLTEAAGLRIINPPDLTLLLADRVNALARLQAGQVPLPGWVIGWGAEATLEAIEHIGYPAQLAVPETSTPVMQVLDREAAEAIVEHRIVLGGDDLFIVQPSVENEHVQQIHIAGDLTVQGDAEDDTYTPGQLSIIARLRAILGEGFYTVEIVGNDTPVVTGITMLDRFRDLGERSQQVADAIAGFALRHVEVAH